MLVVFAGRPGSGKTTLARLVAAELKAAYLRMDAIETAVIRSGIASPPLGAAGYFVAHAVATTSLVAGAQVVVDAVTPVPEARAGWTALASATASRLRMVEVVLTDPVEHQRRVEARKSDLVGLLVPTWKQVMALVYEPWDTRRDGPRLIVINDGSVEKALARVLTYLRLK